MKSRKMRRADGGAVKDVYAGGSSNVVKEANERKRGGRVRKKEVGKVEGAKARMRLDRPGRKTGGRVGADSAPLSSAARTTSRDGGGDDSEDDRGGGYKRGGRLSTGERDKLPRTDFALPGKGEGPAGKGSGSYPIPDASHARAALSRVSANGAPGEKAKVRRAVHRKFPEIGAH